MTNSEKCAACEAILFAAGEPLEIARISEALEIENEETAIHLSNLAAKLEAEDSGICLLRLGNQYQLCSRVEYASQIRTVLEKKKNTPLSQAAFEVLAVVAYNQPVTKGYVEQIRGVDCSGVIATLCQKGLLEERDRLDLPGRPLTYGTTPDFLRCFCLSSLSELPELPDRRELEDDEPDDEIDNEQGEQIRGFFNNISDEAVSEAEKESEENK